MDHMTRAVFCFEDPADNSCKPLMLETILFCPLLTWMSDKLLAEGVKRFFLAASPAYAGEARACFPAEADVTISDSREDLMAFLAEEGPVAVFPCEQIPLDPGDSYAYTAQAADLRRSWAEQGGDAVPGWQRLEGWTAVPHDLPRLQVLEQQCRDAVAKRHMENGVRILDPASVYIDPRVEIGRGTVLLPGTILRGRTRIGRDCTIGPNAVVNGCTLGDGIEVNASQINDSTFGDGCDVGPYAHVRPNCTVGAKCHVGAFVQLKNCVLGEGTKMSHLTYVGDADVGSGVNFGCGTITTNYDGFKKHRCTIGDHAFIGCNTNLIAPVTVGDGAYIAAGATITKDVPPDALAVARARQENKEGWAARRRRMHQQESKK